MCLHRSGVSVCGGLLLATGFLTGCVVSEPCGGSESCSVSLATASDIAGPKLTDGVAMDGVEAQRGHVYLDLSRSMSAFISDADADIPFSLLQEAMDRIIEEAFADVGLDEVVRHGFGTEIHRDVPPLQSFAVQAAGGASPRDRYTKANTDLVRVIRDIGKHPDALSLIITDGVQDRRQGGPEGVVGPGFIRTAVTKALVDELIDRRFGLWLIGLLGPVDAMQCYYNVKPDPQGQVNRCLPVTRRPVYLWVAGADVVRGRQLVAYLVDKLGSESEARRTAPTEHEIEALELWPGSLPTLHLSELAGERITDRGGLSGNVLHRTEVVQGEGLTAMCAQIDQDPDGRLVLAVAADLEPLAPTRFGLPLSVWRAEVSVPEGWQVDDGSSLGVEVDAARRAVVLQAPYETVARQWEVGRLEVPIELAFDPETAFAGHWIRRWSADDDTSVEAITNRTLYLEDVVVGTVEVAMREHRLGRCFHLNVAPR